MGKACLSDKDRCRRASPAQREAKAMAAQIQVYRNALLEEGRKRLASIRKLTKAIRQSRSKSTQDIGTYA